jgi:hypothetical protein
MSEAARLLGVSDRTLKRRIEAGEIVSKLDSLPRGGVCRLVLLDTRAGHESANNARDVRDTKGTTARDTAKSETEASATRAGHESANNERDTRGTPAEVEQLKEQLERERDLNGFFRSLIEQRDRDAAELRAALRKALEAQPRQLTAGEETTPLQQAAEQATGAAVVPESAEQREPQKTAQRKLSTRGEGLRLIRQGFRRLLRS